MILLTVHPFTASHRFLRPGESPPRETPPKPRFMRPGEVEESPSIKENLQSSELAWRKKGAGPTQRPNTGKPAEKPSMRSTARGQWGRGWGIYVYAFIAFGNVSLNQRIATSEGGQLHIKTHPIKRSALPSPRVAILEVTLVIANHVNFY